MSTDELLAEALRLTRVDRARVAEELLSSLEESDEEVATAWAAELERRSRDVAEGRVQTISWETARTEILKELEQRRASRTASSSSPMFRRPSSELARTPDSYPTWPGTRAADPLIRKATIQQSLRDRVRKARAARARPGGRPRQAPATLLAHAHERLKVIMDQENAPPVPVVNDIDQSGLDRDPSSIASPQQECLLSLKAERRIGNNVLQTVAPERAARRGSSHPGA